MPTPVPTAHIKASAHGARRSAGEGGGRWSCSPFHTASRRYSGRDGGESANPVGDHLPTHFLPIRHDLLLHDLVGGDTDTLGDCPPSGDKSTSGPAGIAPRRATEGPRTDGWTRRERAHATMAPGGSTMTKELLPSWRDGAADRAHWAGDDLGPDSSPGAGSRRRWVDRHVVRWCRHGVSPGRRRRRRRLGPPGAARRSRPDRDGGPPCSGIR